MSKSLHFTFIQTFISAPIAISNDAFNLDWEHTFYLLHIFVWEDSDLAVNTSVYKLWFLKKSQHTAGQGGSWRGPNDIWGRRNNIYSKHQETEQIGKATHP